MKGTIDFTATVNYQIKRTRNDNERENILSEMMADIRANIKHGITECVSAKGYSYKVKWKKAKPTKSITK